MDTKETFAAGALVKDNLKCFSSINSTTTAKINTKYNKIKVKALIVKIRMSVILTVFVRAALRADVI